MWKWIAGKRIFVVAFMPLALVTATPRYVHAQEVIGNLEAVSALTSDLGSSSSSVSPQPIAASTASGSARQPGVDWWPLLGETFFFLSVENAFRCATEEGTRDAFGTGFFHGYVNAVGNLHGWNDGDPFYVNYVGHPMQGAVSGFMWTHNDRAYRDIVFGQNRRYWKGKIRSVGYAYVYSVLLEIGPMSEASIGNIQALYPAQGFVDHVVTPFIGAGWGIAEDALDRYLVGYIETRTSNRVVRSLARSGLNPARSMANAMTFRMPWHRDNRTGAEYYRAPNRMAGSNTISPEVTPPPGVAPFEFSAVPLFNTYLGDGHGGSCAGGAAAGALRLAANWQFVVDVGGCKLLGLEKNVSGDSLSYLAGVRRVYRASSRWSAHGELMIGGTKLTQERVYPALQQMLTDAAEQEGAPPPPHSAYSTHWETNGFTVRVKSGVDVKLSNALSLRMASLGYSHSWSNELNGVNYENGLQFSSGLILRMGTW